MALADALRRLATDADLRSDLSARTPLAIAPYALSRVVGEWEALFQQQQAGEWAA